MASVTNSLADELFRPNNERRDLIWWTVRIADYCHAARTTRMCLSAHGLRGRSISGGRGGGKFVGGVTSLYGGAF